MIYLNNEINSEAINEANNGIIEVLKDGINYYFLLDLKKDNNHAIVFSNGAYNPEKLNKPVFMRKNWKDDYESSCIFVDDRTLHHTNLRIGWAVGDEKTHHLIEMSHIIIRILDLWQIAAQNTIYFGSSAGGFKSIMFST